MRKSEKWLIYGLLGFGAFWFYSKSRALTGLVFSPGNITGADINGGNPSISLVLNVANTSDTNLTINSIAATVQSNGTYIGNVYNFSPTLIPANSQAGLPITLQMQVIGLVSDIIKSIETGVLHQQLNLVGSANVNSIQVPLNLSLQL